MKKYLFILLLFIGNPLFGEDKKSWPLKDQLKIDEAKTIKSCGVKIYYRVRGENPDNPILIYLSGHGCSYFPFREPLSKLESRFTMVYLDIRGSGKSDKQGGLEKYKFEYYLQDIENVRKSLNVEKIFIAGHSHMGMVAAEYSIKHPLRVEGLIFDSGSPIDFKGQSIDNLNHVLKVIKNNNDALIPRITTAIKNINEGKLTDEDKKTLRSTRGFLGHIKSPDKIKNAWRKALNGLMETKEYQPEDCASSQFAEQGLYDQVEIRGMKLMEYSILDALDKIKAKTLILLGKHDTLVGEKWAKRFAEGIKNSKLLILENSGHIPLVDEPEKVIFEIKKYFFN